MSTPILDSLRFQEHQLAVGQRMMDEFCEKTNFKPKFALPSYADLQQAIIDFPNGWSASVLRNMPRLKLLLEDRSPSYVLGFEIAAFSSDDEEIRTFSKSDDAEAFLVEIAARPEPSVAPSIG